MFLTLAYLLLSPWQFTMHDNIASMLNILLITCLTITWLITCLLGWYALVFFLDVSSSNHNIVTYVSTIHGCQSKLQYVLYTNRLWYGILGLFRPWNLFSCSLHVDYLRSSSWTVYSAWQLQTCAIYFFFICLLGSYRGFL